MSVHDGQEAIYRRLYAQLEHVAARNLPLPSRTALRETIGAKDDDGVTYQFRYLRDLGLIDGDMIHGVTLRSGSYAGVILKPSVMGRMNFALRPPRYTEGGEKTICAWCSKPHSRKRWKRSAHVAGAAACCSQKCDILYAQHGFGPSKAVIDARTAHIAGQPKGCTDIDSFLRAGGIVYREAPAYVAPSQQVRERVNSMFGNHRVR